MVLSVSQESHATAFEDLTRVGVVVLLRSTGRYGRAEAASITNRLAVLVRLHRSGELNPEVVPSLLAYLADKDGVRATAGAQLERLFGVLATEPSGRSRSEFKGLPHAPELALGIRLDYSRLSPEVLRAVAEVLDGIDPRGLLTA